ncbi:MAG: ABC transporter permease [Spirochaetia bacterium]|nr:ABC transporter permease [Spirochaetia bacterium]
MERLKSALSYILIIVIILALSVVLILSVGSDVQESFVSFFRGIFGSLYGFSEVLVRATPLVMAGLGVSIGFKTGFINIGAEGQIYLGAIAVTTIAFLLPGLPSVFAILLGITAGFIAGGVWALIPGYLKARFGISEVINTIMFNYIAINILGILVRSVLKDPEYPLPMSPQLPDGYIFPMLMYPTRLHLGFLIAVIAMVLVYVLMWKSAPGYKLRVVGLNQRASLCSGIPVRKYIVLSSLLSGGLAGIAGVGEIAGIHNKLLEGFSPGFGYVAIIVALLGKNNPFGVMAAGLGIAALQVGSLSMQRQAGVPASISWIIMGSIVLLILSRRSLFTFSAESRKEKKV